MEEVGVWESCMRKKKLKAICTKNKNDQKEKWKRSGMGGKTGMVSGWGEGELEVGGMEGEKRNMKEVKREKMWNGAAKT